MRLSICSGMLYNKRKGLSNKKHGFVEDAAAAAHREPERAVLKKQCEKGMSCYDPDPSSGG